MKAQRIVKTGCIVMSMMLSSLTFGQNSSKTDDQFEMSVNTKLKGTTFHHFWSFCAGAGRANEGLRANWLEHLELAHKECGFQYLRFHGLFHDDMFVYREENGKPVYNFQYIDELFDRMLQIGVRPFVELSFFPGAISEKPTCFWWGGHGTPPSDYKKWQQLVENFVKHCITRYGEKEVRSWFFEVWNEPNLNGFWNGTQQQYFELYKTTVLAIKNIDPLLKVGGPATSSYHPKEEIYEALKAKKDIKAEDFEGIECRGPWIEEFLAYCEKENLPVDFVSSHPYPTTYPIDSEGNHLELSRPVSSTYTDILWLRKAIAKSHYANTQIHLTEWSSSPSPRDFTHDYLQAATYIVRANLQCIGLVNSLSYWTFTDVFEEGGAGNTIFHGGFGLINFQGIVKPAFHAYRMLNALGDEELARWDGGIVTRSAATKQISALFCYYPKEVVASAPISKENKDVAEKTLNIGSPRKFSIQLTNLKPGTEFTIETLDKDHGFALKEWEKMGSPEPPTREQTKKLRELALATSVVTMKADKMGVLNFEKVLSPWSIVLIKQTSK
jgi:xylan 1,4-beta-xylosidase